MWDVKLCTVICIYVDICMFVTLYMIYLLSSPYLRVFGDDRVRGAREQMLLMQVAQVKLSRGEGIDSGILMFSFILFWKQL